MTQSFKNDLVRGYRQLPMVLHMALSDTRVRYRRSVLGPWWLTLGAAISIAGLGAVWSGLLNQDPAQFIPKLAVGLILWQFISGCITEAPSVFIRQAQIIRNFDLPYSIYPSQLLLRQLITLAHNAAILIGVVLIFPHAFSPLAPLGLLGLVLVAANMLWIAVVVGMIGARYRDIEPLVQSLMPLIFFVTPVIYDVDRLGLNRFIVWANPFSYFMSVVRSPFFGVVPPPFVYGVTLLMLVVGWSLAFWLFNRRGSRIAFWV